MIVVDDKKIPPGQAASTSVGDHSNGVASTSQSEPSRGTAETDHLLVDMGSSIPNEPPPSFSPYIAEFFLTNTEDVVSHDSHLNTDGEALYRFLLAQSQVLPTLRISFKGTHSEMKQRWVNSTDVHGRTTMRSESYTETVIDFDFCVDIRPEHLEPLGSEIHRNSRQDGSGYTPVHWSVGDDEPVCRGKMVREYELPELSLAPGSAGTSQRRKATREEIKRYLEWLEKCQKMGYPPWMRECEERLYADGSIQPVEENVSLKSSKTLRQWADDYCASPKRLKEFVYQKVLYGWNFSQLEVSLRSLVLSSPYNGDLVITFTTHSSKIYVRPSNNLSRMLSNKWLKFFLIIFLIYPFIWLFKRFHRKGGGTWEVCGGAYPLKQWVPLGPGEPVPREWQGIQAEEETLPPYIPEQNPWSNPTLTSRGGSSFSPSSAITPLSSNFSRTSSRRSARYIQTASGMKKLIGLKEGEWFRNWEGLITRAVIGRYQSNEPLRSSALMPAHYLDGYDESLVRV